jgi:hypothetical protein
LRAAVAGSPRRPTSFTGADKSNVPRAPAYPAVQPGETLTLAQVRRIQHAPHD